MNSVIANRYHLLVSLEEVDHQPTRWAALDQTLKGRRPLVAVEMVVPDKALLQQVAQGVQAAAQIGDPSFSQVMGLEQDGDQYFVIRELLPGESVESLTERLRHGQSTLPIAHALSIVAAAARSLGQAHNFTPRLVHDRITPRSVFIDIDGNVRILNLGIDGARNQFHQRTGSGTLEDLRHMSPEQCMGTWQAPQSDVFALGVLLWELLAGRPLFAQESDFDVMEAICEEPIEAPSTFNSQVPPLLDSLVRKALARPAEKRFPDATRMAASLDRLLSNLTNKKRPDLAKFLRTHFPNRVARWESIIRVAGFDQIEDTKRLLSSLFPGASPVEEDPTLVNTRVKIEELTQPIQPTPAAAGYTSDPTAEMDALDKQKIRDQDRTERVSGTAIGMLFSEDDDDEETQVLPNYQTPQVAEPAAPEPLEAPAEAGSEEFISELFDAIEGDDLFGNFGDQDEPEVDITSDEPTVEETVEFAAPAAKQSQPDQMETADRSVPEEVLSRSANKPDLTSSDGLFSEFQPSAAPSPTPSPAPEPLPKPQSTSELPGQSAEPQPAPSAAIESRLPGDSDPTEVFAETQSAETSSAEPVDPPRRPPTPEDHAFIPRIWDDDEIDGDDDELTVSLELDEFINTRDKPRLLREDQRSATPVAEVVLTSGNQALESFVLRGVFNRTFKAAGMSFTVILKGKKAVLQVAEPRRGYIQRARSEESQSLQSIEGDVVLEVGDRAIVEGDPLTYYIRFFYPPNPPARQTRSQMARLALAAAASFLAAASLHVIAVLGFITLSASLGVSLVVEEPPPEEIFAEGELADIEEPEIEEPEPEPPTPQPEPEPQPPADPAEQEVQIPQAVREQLDERRRERAETSDAPQDSADDLLGQLTSPEIGAGESLSDVVSNIDAVSETQSDSQFRVGGTLGALDDEGPSIASGGGGRLGELSEGRADREAGRLDERETSGEVRGTVTNVSALTQVQGSLARSEIERIVNRHRGAITGCYERALNDNPNLSGQITFEWTITSSGDVSSAREQTSSLGSGQVSNCILGIIRGMSFPNPEGGGSVEVAYPFAFQASM